MHVNCIELGVGMCKGFPFLLHYYLNMHFSCFIVASASHKIQNLDQDLTSRNSLRIVLLSVILYSG